MNKIIKIISILILSILIFSQNKALGFSNGANRDYSYSKNFLVKSTPNKDSTDFQIHLVKGSVATFAREKWKKGDTIVIKLKSIKKNKEGLEVGVLPAENLANGWDYNYYGYPIKKTIKTSEDEVEFNIQAD